GAAFSGETSTDTLRSTKLYVGTSGNTTSQDLVVFGGAGIQGATSLDTLDVYSTSVLNGAATFNGISTFTKRIDADGGILVPAGQDVRINGRFTSANTYMEVATHVTVSGYVNTERVGQAYAPIYFENIGGGR